jgi:hypothetical protein
MSGTEVLVPGHLYRYQLDAARAGTSLMSTARLVVEALRQLSMTRSMPSDWPSRLARPSGPLDLITLRAADHDTVAAAIDELPGVVVTPLADMLPTDPRFAPPSSARSRTRSWASSTGTPGWRVVSVNQNGGDVDVLTEVAPKPAPSVALTLDRAVQDAAQHAVDTRGQKAMLVVLRPSTGDILALAQNAAADADGPAATTGLYPPGSTFKIVTAHAATAAGHGHAQHAVGLPR